MRLNRGTVHSRSGTSLVELIVAIVVFGILGAIAIAQLSASARSLTALTDRLDSQSALWHGADVASVELQAVSPVGGDLLLVSDSSLWYRGLVASGVLCSAPSGTSIHVLPDSLASGLRPATGMASLQPGDLVLVFDEGPRSDASDDRWFPATLSSVSSVTDLCTTSPYVDPVRDAGRAGYRLRMQASAIPITVTTGAGVRVLRPSRLVLYRSAPDWFLGWADWNSALGGWNVIQPVAGSYRPFAPSPLPSGVQMELRDSLGASLIFPASPAAVGSVGVALRTQVFVRGIGGGPGQVQRTDSLELRVALRNRR